MTDRVTRLYALAIAVLGFFLAWAAVAAQPWKAAAAPAGASPVAAELTAVEGRLARDAVLVDVLAKRRAGRAAAARHHAAPRVVVLPRVTVTRTS